MLLAIVTLVAGVAALVIAGQRGEAELHLVLIFPVVSGTGPYFALGVLLFMAGLLMLFVGMSMRSIAALEDLPPGQRAPPGSPPGRAPGAAPPAGRPEWGGVVFIGPVPLAFGSSPRMGRWMTLASIVMGILFLVFILGLLL